MGGAQQRVGLAERDFVGSTITDFIEPLQKFLDTDMKTIAKEKRLLDTRRLDCFTSFVSSPIFLSYILFVEFRFVYLKLFFYAVFISSEG